MTKTQRIRLIENIQAERNSTVICYVTGDRPSSSPSAPSLATQIAIDSVRYLRDILDSIGQKEQIDLFIYSRGGDITAPSPIVHLIRKHCKKLGVLVPYKAHSAATLISLGADEVVMGKMGQLSPIDPTTFNVFNPQDPLNPVGRWQISVEDVTAYLLLAKEKAGLDSEGSARQVFMGLADKVHPIALGNVHRIYNLIRLLAPKLLGLHMNHTNVQEQGKIKLIVDTLTEKLYTHDYVISCEEAKQIGLKVSDPNEKVDNMMWDLYKEYEKDLKLLEPFDPGNVIMNNTITPFTEHGAYLESSKISYAFVTEGEVYPPPSLNQVLQMMPQQALPQLLPQIYQAVQQLPLMVPAVKINTQKWLSI